MKTLLIIVGVLAVGAGLIVYNNSGNWNFNTQPSHVPQAASNNRNSQVQSQSLDLTDDDPVLGDANSPVTLVEFGDYQCTFCTRFFKETEPTLIEKYVNTGKLKIVFRDLVVNGKESQNAALAAECAGDQDKYWEYHNKLYQERKGYNTGTFNKDNLIIFAHELGLDENQFRQCYDEERHKDEIVKDVNGAFALGANGTPSFFLNGKFLSGAQPLAVFENLIEQELANN